MPKKVLAITSSLRGNSNSEAVADAFLKGAAEAGNETEKISLAGKSIGFCRGCLVCQKTQRCVIEDDAIRIVQKMLSADVLVFATPIYYYEMSGQLKTLLDRANPLYTADYAFRSVYLITSSAENGEYVSRRALNGFEGWVSCFDKARIYGTVFAGGVTDEGDIKDHKALDKAYKMGAGV